MYIDAMPIFRSLSSLFFIWNLHTVYGIMSNFTVISVHTENSYELWIYDCNRIYFDIIHLHRESIDPKTIQMISLPAFCRKDSCVPNI